MIVLPVMAGIGNAILTVPLARALGRRGTLVVEAGNKGIADVFGRLPEVERVETLPKGLAGLSAHVTRCKQLRPDFLVLPFPANRWQYTALAITSGARRIVMHRYPVGRWSTGRALLQRATFVDAIRGIHDVEQNLRLLEQFDGSCGFPTRSRDRDELRVENPQLPFNPPTFPLNDRERKSVDERVNAAIVVQAGCANTPVGRAKRLPPETWATVVDQLADAGERVVLIEGPDERGVGAQVAPICKTSPIVLPLTGTLGESAAVLERAKLFVGVDSGLGHLAAAVGTPVVAVFAAADPDRVCPYGHRRLVVTPPDVNGVAWRPRALYPMDAAGPKLRDDGIDWPAHVRAADLVERALAALRSGA